MIKFFLTLAILFFVFKCIFSTCRLLYLQNKAARLFKPIDKLLEVRYKLISEIIKTVSNSNTDFISHKLETLINLDNNVKNIDTKINTNYILTKELITIKENFSFFDNDILEKLNSVAEKIENIKQTYNKTAIKLKNATEVFPGSIIARFLRITSIDCLNQDLYIKH